MKNHITDEKTGIGYTLQGDYYLPDLALPAEEEQPIDIWGQRHLRYLRQHKRLLYINLLTSCKLSGYLADIDRQAEEMFSRLVKEMADREGVTEELKAKDQMVWGAGRRWRPLPKAEAPTEPAGETGKMNNIRSRATEIVNNELIYS